MYASAPRGFTLRELIVVILLIAILSAIVIPLQRRQRELARRTSCASNLNQIAKACFLYADVPANGRFPTTATTGDPFADENPARALNLLYKGYVQDPRVFSCPSKPVAARAYSRIVTPANVSPADNGLLIPAHEMSYGYDPGHTPDDAVAAIAADKKGAGRNSDNHGKDAGQNVLIGAGTVEFRSSPALPLGDDAAGKPMEDPDVFARNEELKRNVDGHIRQ